MISSTLSLGQVERKEKKERNAAPQMNNSMSEPEVEEIQNISSSKSSVNKKQLKTQQVSSSLSVTVSQASRMRTQKSYTEEQTKKLSDGVDQLKKIDQSSFEYHLYSYLKTPFNFDELESLKKAESINSYDYSVLTSFAAYHYIKNDQSQLNSYLSKLYQGKYFSDELILHADIVLNSLPRNSFLITHGKDDTYPILINQKIKNTRKDVEIISLDHLLSEVYRESLKTKGFKIPGRSKIDTQFLAQFMEMNKSKSIICANTLPAPYLKAMDSDLNIVGFGFSLVFEDYANVKYYEKEFSLKLPSLIAGNNKIVLSNSLPLLFEVRNQYIGIGKYAKAEKVEKWIRAVGGKIGKTEQINSLLK